MTAVPNYAQPLTTGNQTNTAWYKFFSSLPTVAGTYSSTFQSGYIQYTGASGELTASINFILGTAIPNGSGTPGPALLLGSGGGSGTPASAWILTDQAYDDVTPGNNLYITAGETQGAGTANGGMLTLYGGASFGGTGGTLQLQGGTSKNGPGGIAVLQGGNSTSGVAGDAFVTGGQAGTAGANVHLIMTTVNGTSGVIRMRVNSTPLWDFYPDGSIYSYLGGGFGTSGQTLTSQGAGLPVKWS